MPSDLSIGHRRNGSITNPSVFRAVVGYNGTPWPVWSVGGIRTGTCCNKTEESCDPLYTVETLWDMCVDSLLSYERSRVRSFDKVF